MSPGRIEVGERRWGIVCRRLLATDHSQLFRCSATLHPLPLRACAHVLRAHANGVVIDEAIIQIE